MCYLVFTAHAKWDVQRDNIAFSQIHIRLDNNDACRHMSAPPLKKKKQCRNLNTYK